LLKSASKRPANEILFLDKKIVIRSDGASFDVVDYKLGELYLMSQVCQIECPYARGFDLENYASTGTAFEYYWNGVMHGYNDDSTRWQTFMQIIGYLMYPSSGQAIVLCDDGNTSNGQTGKSVLGSYLAWATGGVVVDGNRLISNDNHALSIIKEHSTFVALDDVPQRFNQRDLYTAINEGFDVNPKGSARYSVKSKILISTNFNFDVTDSSNSNRFRLFDLTGFWRNTAIKHYQTLKVVPFITAKQGQISDHEGIIRLIISGMMIYAQCGYKINDYTNDVLIEKGRKSYMNDDQREVIVTFIVRYIYDHEINSPLSKDYIQAHKIHVELAKHMRTELLDYKYSHKDSKRHIDGLIKSNDIELHLYSGVLKRNGKTYRYNFYSKNNELTNEQIYDFIK